MSDNANAAVEIAEEAVEQKLDNLNISDSTNTNSEERGRRRRLPTAERVRIWEEEQKNKVVISTGLKGTVKWYSVLGRYGFIARSDGEQDVFVHQTAIAKSATNKFYLRTLGDEEEVVFDLVEGKKGPEAANVTGPNGENVNGSRFRHLLLSRFRKLRRPRHAGDGDAPKQEEKADAPKKQKKQRKSRPRKARRDNNASLDAPQGDEAAALEKNPEQELVIKKIIDEKTTTIERCGSAIGEATLGAQAVDAQI